MANYLGLQAMLNGFARGGAEAIGIYQNQLNLQEQQRFAREQFEALEKHRDIANEQADAKIKLEQDKFTLLSEAKDREFKKYDQEQARDFMQRTIGTLDFMAISKGYDSVDELAQAEPETVAPLLGSYLMHSNAPTLGAYHPHTMRANDDGTYNLSYKNGQGGQVNLGDFGVEQSMKDLRIMGYQMGIPGALDILNVKQTPDGKIVGKDNKPVPQAALDQLKALSQQLQKDVGMDLTTFLQQPDMREALLNPVSGGESHYDGSGPERVNNGQSALNYLLERSNQSLAQQRQSPASSPAATPPIKGAQSALDFMLNDSNYRSSQISRPQSAPEPQSQAAVSPEPEAPAAETTDLAGLRGRQPATTARQRGLNDYHARRQFSGEDSWQRLMTAATKEPRDRLGKRFAAIDKTEPDAFNRAMQKGGAAWVEGVKTGAGVVSAPARTAAKYTGKAVWNFAKGAFHSVVGEPSGEGNFTVDPNNKTVTTPSGDQTKVPETQEEHEQQRDKATGNSLPERERRLAMLLAMEMMQGGGGSGKSGKAGSGFMNSPFARAIMGGDFSDPKEAADLQNVLLRNREIAQRMETAARNRYEDDKKRILGSLSAQFSTITDKGTSSAGTTTKFKTREAMEAWSHGLLQQTARSLHEYMPEVFPWEYQRDSQGNIKKDKEGEPLVLFYPDYTQMHGEYYRIIELFLKENYKAYDPNKKILFWFEDGQEPREQGPEYGEVRAAFQEPLLSTYDRMSKEERKEFRKQHGLGNNDRAVREKLLKMYR